jgi:hypothetical protein
MDKAGIQRIPLADHGVQLRPNVLYKWFVAVITDPDRRSRDILSGGMIEVVSASPELSARLAQTPKARLPFVLAEGGLWYDALAGVSDMIDAAPKDLSLRKQRAALLDQVGLNEAAEFDLKRLARPVSLSSGCSVTALLPVRSPEVAHRALDRPAREEIPTSKRSRGHVHGT